MVGFDRQQVRALMSDEVPRSCRDVAAALGWSVVRARRSLHNMATAGELSTEPSGEITRNRAALLIFRWCGIQPRKQRRQYRTPRTTRNGDSLLSCALRALCPLQRAWA